MLDEAALEAIRSAVRDAVREAQPAARPRPWGEFRREVLRRYRPPACSPAAAYKVRRVLDLVGRLGPRSSADLTPALLREFVALGPSWSRPTAEGYLAYLSAICSYAVSSGDLLSSPFDGGGPPLPRGAAPRPARPSHLSRDQVARLLAHTRAAAAGSWAAARTDALIHVYAYTGLRRDEALTRHVADFDLGRQVLDLTPRRKPHKTAGSAAPVPIPDELAEVLAEWLPRTGSVWAFPGSTGRGPWLGGPYGRRPNDEVARAGRESGVGRVCPQLLRHTFATMAEDWGYGELLAQRLMRHAQPSTTRRYRHADEAALVAAARGATFRPRAG